jgi:hypothetical protein
LLTKGKTNEISLLGWLGRRADEGRWHSRGFEVDDSPLAARRALAFLREQGAHLQGESRRGYGGGFDVIAIAEAADAQVSVLRALDHCTGMGGCWEKCGTKF